MPRWTRAWVEKMIYPDELRKILMLANLHLNKFSVMLGRVSRLISVELGFHEETGMPLSHKRSKQVLEFIDRQICEEVLGKEICELIESNVFFTKEQFSSLLETLKTNSHELARAIGLDSKSLYMVIKSNQGMNFASVLNLYFFFPEELDRILTDAQKDRIFKYKPAKHNEARQIVTSD